MVPPTINDSKCVLVTGATSGIGRALALAIADLPSRPKVVATGRRQERLDEIKSERIEMVRMDVDADQETLKKYVEHIVAKYPELDTIIFNAGIQRQFDFSRKKDADLDELQREFNVNYLSVVTLITYFMPHLLKLASTGRPCFIIPVTSALALSPGPWVPNYCATKAALHSFSASLQVQLRDTNVHVLEILPPLVESELHDAEGATERLSKTWMPLDKFIAETMDGLRKGEPYICSGMAKDLFEKYEREKLESMMARFR